MKTKICRSILKIVLKVSVICDVLFSEKWVMTTFKGSKETSQTKYDSKELK